VTPLQNYLKRSKPTTIEPKKKLSPKIGDKKLLSTTNSLEGEKIFTNFSGNFRAIFQKISGKFL
jgi:hypothetical protein